MKTKRKGSQSQTPELLLSKDQQGVYRVEDRSPNRKPKDSAAAWPRKVTVGRESITVYRRLTPLGNFAFKVANYSTGKRRFDCYPNEAAAIEAAKKLAGQMSERDVLA